LTYVPIQISSLLVSNTNDRHGELADEQEAIEWLLRNHYQHMLNLADDIAHSGKIYEPPIVFKEGSNYRVYDGNRRVASIKLLENPHRVPEELGRKPWEAKSALWREKGIETIECRIEDDISLINEILVRRHTGAQGGIGQTTWDNAAKQNFLRRTGRIDTLTNAELIEVALRENNQIPADMRVLRSKVDRLFSASKFRKPYGFDIKDNEIVYYANKDEVLSALRQTVTALNKKNVTLADIWDEEKKLRYIEKCRVAGILPSLAPTEVAPAKRQSKSPSSKQISKPTRQPPPPNLVPHSAASKLSWSSEWSRLRDVWDELQFSLTFDSHQNSISVLFRVLIELVISDYSRVIMGSTIDEDKALTDRLVLVARDLNNRGEISKQQLRDLEPLIHNERSLSPKLLHKFVHSPHAFPSREHLIAMWRNLEPLLVSAIIEIEKAR